MPPPPARLTERHVEEFIRDLSAIIYAHKTLGDDLRLTQILGNIFGKDPYYMEDPAACLKLKEYLATHFGPDSGN